MSIGSIRYWFKFNQLYYGKNTKIQFSKDFLIENQKHDINIWEYARYDHSIIDYNNLIHYFYPTNFIYNSKFSTKKYMSVIQIPNDQLPFVIKSILCPKITSVTEDKFTSFQNCIAWIIYIILMFLSLILKQYYMGWITLTIIMIYYMKGKKI